METKPQRRTLVVLLKSRTTDGKIAGSKLIVMITNKTHKCKENGRHAATLEIPGRAYKDCFDKLKKPTVKSDQTIMLTLSIGGVPLRQYDPRLMRARSRFEGVRTPRNDWNRRLRTKTAVEQTSSTSTSKRDGGICFHHTHDAGKRWSKTKNIGQTYNGIANLYYKQSRKQRGGRLLR